MQLLLPIDTQLNAAINDIVGRILPNGYDVSDVAPQTYEALRDLIRSGRKLAVWSGGSNATIYADQLTNHAFRAWHDWTHWLTAQPFTIEGETEVCAAQCRQLVADFGINSMTERWCRLIEAEVIGQNTFYRMHKRFPEDQIGFVTAYLKDPQSALLWSLW